MSDLIISAFTPVLGSGQGLRTYGVARALARLGPVEILYATFGADEPAPEYQSAGIPLHPVRPTRGWVRLLSYGRTLGRGVPESLARGVSAELARTAELMAAEPGRGRVIADGPVAAAALLPLAGRRAVIYNAHNLESAFRHLIGSTERSRRRLERFECQVLMHFTETWMATAVDTDAARRLSPQALVRYVPNVVDVTGIRPITSPSGTPRVLFIGDFRYRPNRDGLRYLVDEVMPLLWRGLPSARLAVVGRGLNEPPSKDARVEHLGFVADLAATYESAACVAIPLLAGGGSPLKFVEALAYGSAVVATPVAAAGLEATAGRDYLEAPDPPTFSAAIARILRGEAPDLGARARCLAEREYSIESLTERLANPTGQALI